MIYDDPDSPLRPSIINPVVSLKRLQEIFAEKTILEYRELTNWQVAYVVERPNAFEAKCEKIQEWIEELWKKTKCTKNDEEQFHRHWNYVENSEYMFKKDTRSHLRWEYVSRLETIEEEACQNLEDVYTKKFEEPSRPAIRTLEETETREKAIKKSIKSVSTCFKDSSSLNC